MWDGAYNIHIVLGKEVRTKRGIEIVMTNKLLCKVSKNHKWDSIKFMFSKKATEIEKNLHRRFDTYLVHVKSMVKILSIFVALNMNFYNT